MNLNDPSSMTFCGGFLIAPRFIATSTHCFSDSDLPSKILILIGSLHIFHGQPLKVKEIIRHEKEDISLIFIEQSLEQEKTIPLSNRNERSSEFVTFFGFGAEKFVKSKPVLPKYLQKATVKILNTKFTHNKYLFATTGNLEPGDSGSAILWREGGKMVAGGIYKGVDHVNNVQLFYRVKDFRTWFNNKMAIAIRGEEF
ncbi:hypothetical protein ACQ4LE_003661 [Meloidogyne hapla]